jgi:MYXO-CTERM domain-containing protein
VKPSAEIAFGPPAGSTPPTNLSSANFRRLGTTLALVVAYTGLCGVARAQSDSKTLIDYFQPIPITCSPLSTATWGVSDVLPRDICNGIESARGAGVPPESYFWDGKIIKAKDGTHHLFGSFWSGTIGFSPGWWSSDAFHATSTEGVLGPYELVGYAYDNGPDQANPHKGHNVSAVELLDGTYALLVSEIVPLTIFTSDSLDGPWENRGHASIDTNGVPLSIPPPGDTHLESNVSLVVRPDGDFEIIQRHGIIALSTTGILGPYKVQQPTTTYPQSEAVPSSLASIFPNRQAHVDPEAPSSLESTYALAEDPVIWYSGGQYHVIYNYPGDRVAYHLTSPDGIHDWTDEGLAYDPRLAEKLFRYEGDSTLNKWYKMERPGVVMEGGHVTHVTFAVSDVDKNDQIPANSNHGSKIIVVPFDGATFDADTGDSGVGGMGAGGADNSGGTSSVGGAQTFGGSTATGGASSEGGAQTSGGSTATGGTNAEGGAQTSGGSTATGGASPEGGAQTSGGSTATGGAQASGGRSSTGGSSTTSRGGSVALGGSTNPSTTGGVAGSRLDAGGGLATGGAFGGSSGASAGATTSLDSETGNDDSGCGCKVAVPGSPSKSLALFGMLVLAGFRSLRRQRDRSRCA